VLIEFYPGHQSELPARDYLAAHEKLELKGYDRRRPSQSKYDQKVALLQSVDRGVDNNIEHKIIEKDQVIKEPSSQLNCRFLIFDERINQLLGKRKLFLDQICR
jgi:hypothetical protein